MDSTIDLQFVEYIVKSLVGKPDEVKIQRTIDEKGVLLELTVDPEDLGRVIGKRGATAQSLRTLLRALGTKNDARYNLKIVDNGEPRPERTDRPMRDDRREEGDRYNDRQNDRPAREDNSAVTSDDASAPVNDDTAAPTAEDSGASTDDGWGTSSAKSYDRPAEVDHSDAISKARKDLADLDDLDI